MRRIHANPTLNSVQHDVEVGRLLTPRMTKRVNGFNAMRQLVLERRGEVTHEIDVKLRLATSYEATIATKIRGYLRALPDKERFATIADAIKADHFISLYQAVASVPAFLSRLHPARHADVRQECQGLVAPEYVALEAGLDVEAVKLLRAAEGVARIFNQRFASTGMTSSPSWRRAKPRRQTALHGSYPRRLWSSLAGGGVAAAFSDHEMDDMF